MFPLSFCATKKELTGIVSSFLLRPSGLYSIFDDAIIAHKTHKKRARIVQVFRSFDFQILNQYRMLWENFARGADHNFPRSILYNKYNQYVSTAPAYVSYYVEDGDFVKIDNITLGYTLPKSVVNSIRLNNVRVFFRGNNLLTFSKFDWWDPELGSSNGQQYPLARTFTLGLTVNL